ncbi:MAG TPA: glycosyltransferase family 2 protein [Anaerolineales bacterium]|nr:glycosyltransferase family 2 protein [Anaerolineales bacterium]
MQPKVSIIVPCYNEQSTIRLLLEALREQTFPRADMEVVIADGISQDGTRDAIALFQRDYSDLDVRVVDNKSRTIPAAVNRAIQASRGEIIVRMDAHSKPYPDYVQNCVNALEGNLGDTIGGIWEIHPGAESWVAKSIAVAAAHPLGVGDAFYRHTKQAAEVDTVPFGSFRRSLIDRVGYFDESLLTNEDYEFYVRVKKAGGRIWLDPSIRSIYFARATLSQLARQYRRYGFWKWRMLRRYPHTLRWRQALPPLFVLSVIVLGLVSLFIPFVGILLAIEILLYFSILLFVGLRVALRRRKHYLLFGLPLAISIMHVSWGGGFLWSILTAGFQKNG